MLRRDVHFVAVIAFLNESQSRQRDGIGDASIAEVRSAYNHAVTNDEDVFAVLET